MEKNKTEAFLKRTQKHIQMVRANLMKFVGYQGLSKDELELRGRLHDLSKFSPEEQEAYIWLTWKYQNPSSELPEDKEEVISQGLKIHAHQNRHHPEAHANKNDMGLLDVVEMIADWTAIAQEHGRSSCHSWAMENLDKKWNFSDAKKSQIFEIIAELDKRNKNQSEIYFLRHGESVANTQGILCGTTDVNLTSHGKNQVLTSALATLDLNFDLILTSPLTRAQESSSIVSLHHPLAQVEIEADLTEQNYGEWEGRPFLEVKEQFLQNLNPPEGESHSSFKDRLRNLATQLKSTSGKILLVSHGGVGSQLLEEFGHTKRLIDNAEIIKLL